MPGRPAARVTDMHVCPMATPGTPPIPHVGGPILPTCSPNVLTGGLPQARVTDQCVCVGPLDQIVQGSPTVLVNNLLAARIGDLCAHGGQIVTGFPTVLIGDAANIPPAIDAGGGLAFSPPSNVTISGTDAFKAKTLAVLEALSKTATGKALLKSLEDSGKPIKIIETTEANGYSRRDSDDANLKADGTAGPGSGSTVSFNPSFEPGVPNTVVLGHELIHADHNAHGVRDERKNNDPNVKNEELHTVGLPPYPSEGITENSLRKDLGKPTRTRY